MPTIDVIPMTTPRMVSPDRILFVRTVSNAIATTSQRRAKRRVMDGNAPPRRTQRTRRSERTGLFLCVPRVLRGGEDVWSFAPQRLDRVESRGPHRRIEAEEQADERRDADPEHDGPDLHRRGNRRERRDGRRDRAAKHRAD